MSQIIPLITREVADYRFWLRHSSNPDELRDVGLHACDDLEETLILLDEISGGDAPGQMELPFGWTVTENRRVPAQARAE